MMFLSTLVASLAGKGGKMRSGIDNNGLSLGSGRSDPQVDIVSAIALREWYSLILIELPANQVFEISMITRSRCRVIPLPIWLQIPLYMGSHMSFVPRQVTILNKVLIGRIFTGVGSTMMRQSGINGIHIWMKPACRQVFFFSNSKLPPSSFFRQGGGGA
jgi:hypothetical protein